MFHRDEGPYRFGVGLPGGNRNQFLFGITQGGQLSTEDAARIDVDGAIEPFRFGHRRVAVM
jgi:hypothetical protein